MSRGKKIIFYAENTMHGPIRRKRGVRQELFHLNMKSSRQLLHFSGKKTLPAQLDHISLGVYACRNSPQL